MKILPVLFLLAGSPLFAEPLAQQEFDLREPAEVVATITARCAGCDWAKPGREAVLLELRVDGVYSQHVALIRGAGPASYRVMLGGLGQGRHALTATPDTNRSAPQAGPATIDRIAIQVITRHDRDYPWIARAPVLRARPGTVEHFSDYPLLMYAEKNVGGEGPAPYQVQYTVIFTNEDGGTPTDRLMATWGRTTDIEFVYGVTSGTGSRPTREVIQAQGHKWIDFGGTRAGGHPELWVATENNMVSDHGADDLIRFAPAPMLVSLDRVSREHVMDAEPWTYAVTSAEMMREGRVDAAAQPGSGKIPDPRRYAVVEACGDVSEATLAFDMGVTAADGTVTWYATDRADPDFRIARGGCFRSGTPLPEGVSLAQVTALRVRAYRRPSKDAPARPVPAARAVLRRVNQLSMLNENFLPEPSAIEWSGRLTIDVGGPGATIPLKHAR